MKMLDKAAVSYQIILTKADKVSDQNAQKMKESVAKIGAKHVACHPNILITSADKKMNIDLLRTEFVKVLKGI